MIFNFIPKWQDGLVWLGWALGVTIVFYLVFPILWGKAGRNFTESLKVFGICVIVSTISKATNIFFPEGEKYWQWSFLRFLPAFSSGLLVYSIWRDFYDSKTNKSQGSCYLVLGLALLAVRIWGDSSLLLSTVYFDSFSFGLIILGGILLRLDPGGCQILIQRWGRISYSVYLTHPLAVFSLTPVYKYMSDRLLSDSLLFFFSALLTLIIVGLISTLFRFYIEEPGEKFGDKIAERFRLVMQNKYSKAER
jgi:peptidoglycan/LPS O-acetylase OafA/YrhL